MATCTSMGTTDDVPQLWAIGIDDGEMRSVEMPDGVTEWEPNLLSTSDNHLFAFGRGRRCLGVLAGRLISRPH